MKTNHILALLAFIGGAAAAFTNFTQNNHFYPDWKYQKVRIDGQRIHFISAPQLADLIYTKKEGVIILDTRDREEYGKYHIPKALQYHEGMMKKADFSSGTVILCGEEEGSDPFSSVSELPGRVYVLKGGMEAWYSLVLFPDFIKYHVRNSDQLDHILQVSGFFGGKPRNTQVLNVNMRKENYREGC